MTELRKFDVGDIISIADGRLVSRRHMDGVYDILQYMTGEQSLWTHQLLRAGEVCKPYLVLQHPDLANVGALPTLKGGRENQEHDQEIINNWLDQFGPPRVVKPLPDGVWNHKGPLEEAVELFGEDQVVIAVKSD